MQKFNYKIKYTTSIAVAFYIQFRREVVGGEGRGENQPIKYIFLRPFLSSFLAKRERNNRGMI